MYEEKLKTNTFKYYKIILRNDRMFSLDKEKNLRHNWCLKIVSSCHIEMEVDFVLNSTE